MSITPGPWGVDWNAPNNIIAEDGSGRFVARVAPGGGAEASANAALIAAAPDLLRFAESVAELEHHKSCGREPGEFFGDGRPCDCLITAARTAIAEARGESS